MESSLIRLAPIYQQRVWGGRTLETFYGRELPKRSTPYGESWEVADREDAQCSVVGGRFDDRSLNDLWRNHREEIFGQNSLSWNSDRFPILVKILDAREKLSIQVHPPAEVAAELDGEPKTEMWYIVDADPGAELFLGLKKGVTRESFEKGIAAGETANQVHTVVPKPGEFILIPSGRLHAIGAGLLIFEIQQNSDTTYRVFDWNRVGLEGKPRDLHLEQSLKCIRFDDVEPSMDVAHDDLLVGCDYFDVRRRTISPSEESPLVEPGEFAIISVISGSLTDAGGDLISKGEFFLIPASAPDGERFSSDEGAEILITRLPESPDAR